PGASSRRASARAAAVAAPAARIERSSAGDLYSERRNTRASGRGAVVAVVVHEGAQAALGEGREDALRHLVERADAVDLHDESLRAVDVEDRRGLALVDREPVRDDLFGVVGAALVDRPLSQA